MQEGEAAGGQAGTSPNLGLLLALSPDAQLCMEDKPQAGHGKWSPLPLLSQAAPKCCEVGQE